jgi:hypothetical protein
MYSSTLNTDYTLYHEIIKHDDIDCAKIIQFKAGDYGYILDHNMSISRGYKTVSDCKKILFLLLDKLKEQELKELHEQEEEEQFMFWQASMYNY